VATREDFRVARQSFLTGTSFYYVDHLGNRQFKNRDLGEILARKVMRDGAAPRIPGKTLN
jgi:hypothetical protein